MKTNNWKDLFAFTKQERNGIIVLSILVFLAAVYLVLRPFFTQDKIECLEVPQEFKQSLTDSFSDSVLVKLNLPQQDREQEQVISEEQHSVYQQHEMFYFNPNGLAESDWVKLGLSPAQAKSVKNFERKGGVFRNKEDVRKLYVISAEKYSELEPYIVIKESKDSSGFAHKIKSDVVYELNTADTNDLVKISGIGPVFSRRIVAYRERLGGFHSKNQLLEVFGFTEEKYAQVEPFVKADSVYIRKINVNAATVAELKKHPYITPAVANGIVSYRKQHGPYKQLLDVMGCHLVNAELYRKIAPYLTL